MAELVNSDNYQDFTLDMLETPDGMTKLNNILRQLSQNISGDTEQVRVFSGVGTPEASITAGIGSLYMRTDGSADTSVYRKESGTGNTGWVAIVTPPTPVSYAFGTIDTLNDDQTYTATTDGFVYATGTSSSGTFDYVRITIVANGSTYYEISPTGGLASTIMIPVKAGNSYNVKVDGTGTPTNILRQFMHIGA